MMKTSSVTSQPDTGHLAERYVLSGQAPNPAPPKIWAVAQVFSKRARSIRADIEAQHRATRQPTYAKVWYVDGKRSSKERELLPGYLFFQTSPDDWGDVGAIEGVIRVLSNGGVASRVSDREANQIFLNAAMGAYDQVEQGEPARRKRRRRPRPSKRARAMGRVAA